MSKRTIYMGADAAGYALKESLKQILLADGYAVHDMGCHSDESCHYPLFAFPVAEAVAANPDTTFGILICGTGIGMSMCANKYHGVRAALCTNKFMGEMTRAHNNANVLCMGARVLELDTAKEIMAAFLSTPFDGGRHQTRLDIISEIESKNFK